MVPRRGSFFSRMQRGPGGEGLGELDDAEKAEKLIRNLARRLEHEAPSACASILKRLDEIRVED